MTVGGSKTIGNDIVAVTILGATGTIGLNTLDVLSRHPQRYRVFALTANTDDNRLLAQCVQYKPAYAVMMDPSAADRLAVALKENNVTETEVLAGMDGLEAVVQADECDVVMAGIVGAAGLLPTLAAARAGKRILLANKESLVMAGRLFMEAVHDGGAILLPVDSEHNAIWQCMPPSVCELGGQHEALERGLTAWGVEKILLTASGGPFRRVAMEELASKTPEEACSHPNWKMGRKISVDSATMMNKGLELIEACWLFNTKPDSIEVVLHPESVIHSMVAYSDGSVLAQMGHPDMRTPIAHALGWPNRIQSGVEPLDVFGVANLSFEKPDYVRFPCLRLAQGAAAAGGTATAILNAANEVAVGSFLDRRIRFTDIAVVVEQVMDKSTVRDADSLETILEDDQWAREHASHFVAVRH